MKKIIFSAATLLFFCGITAFKAPPPAVVSDTHLDLNIAGNVFNPCNGETVAYEGRASVDLHTVANGNRFSGHIHRVLHSTGTGDQGNEYLLLLTENQPLSFSLVNGQFVSSFLVNEEFVSKGAAPNFIVTVRIHITVNANGTVTVTRNEVSVSCKG